MYDESTHFSINTRLVKTLTLCADQYNGHIGAVPKVRHLRIVVVDRVETALVFETEHKDDGVHPGGKLKYEKWKTYILIN